MIPQAQGITSAAAVESAFQKRFARRPQVLVRAPGRVNLLGAHVDYQEGWVLPTAIDRGLWLAASLSSGATGTLHALDLAETGSLTPTELPLPLPSSSRSLSWLDYPRGIAWAMKEQGFPPPPLDIVFGGNLPRESGVSSSAALEVAFLLAWRELAQLDLSRDDIARLGRRVENEYLGIGSGIMDQLASLHGREGHMLLLDCRDLSKAWVPMPSHSVFLVADSGVRRRLAASGFNNRPAECDRALRQLREHGFDLATLRDLPLSQLPEAAELLEPALARRVQHVVQECDRVHRGSEALRQGQVAEFGKLVETSHRSSRDLYEVSIPELDVLAETAWQVPGVYGARLSGGGFGGCVTALLENEAAEEVSQRMTEAFEKRFHRPPAGLFLCASAQGADCQRC